MRMMLDEQGLTFLEIMVSVVIIGLLIVALYGLLDGGMAMYQTSDAHLELLQQMRLAMEAIGRDIRRASSVSFNPNNNELTINLPEGPQKYGLDNEDIYGPSGLKGQQLWVTTKNNPLASYLSDFKATKENKLVTIILKAQTPKGNLLTLQSSFTLRN
jgi:prepilin-type N-terminal cleavage/methylation domain-containing protein